MVKPTTNMATEDENIPQEPKPNDKQQPFMLQVIEKHLRKHEFAAVVLGNGVSRGAYRFADLKYWGTTYSCNAAYRDFFTDYLVVMDEHMLHEVIEARAYEDTIVYTQHTNDREVMSKTIPIYFTTSEPATLDSGSAATKLAAQHGHKIVWLVGFDGMCKNHVPNLYAGTPNYPHDGFYAAHGKLARGWQENLQRIMREYPYTQFYHVHDQGINCTLPNYHQIPHRLFEQIIKGKNYEQNISY